MPIDPTNDASLAALAPGVVVGNRYTLIKVSGLGGMGVVWHAHDRLSAEDVALKFIPRIISSDGAAARELRREAERACRLKHPNICRVYDFAEDEEKGLAWIGMEYLPGGTLADKLEKHARGFFECEEIGDWTRQLCEALEYAHEQASIVHRDLKPANLLLDAKGQVKITDFGISGTLCESFTRLTGRAPTKPGTTGSGTPLYMSPQQARGGRPRATDDLYALGATLFELLTGRAPFYDGDVSWQRMHVPPPRVSERREERRLKGAEIPEHWEITLLRLLAKQPEHRPQSARDTAQALRVAAPPPVPSVYKPAPKNPKAATTKLPPPPKPSAISIPAVPRLPSAAPTEPGNLPEPPPPSALQSVQPRPAIPASVPFLPAMPNSTVVPPSRPLRRDPWLWALIALSVVAIVLLVLVVVLVMK